MRRFKREVLRRGSFIERVWAPSAAPALAAIALVLFFGTGIAVVLASWDFDRGARAVSAAAGTPSSDVPAATPSSRGARPAPRATPAPPPTAATPQPPPVTPVATPPASPVSAPATGTPAQSAPGAAP